MSVDSKVSFRVEASPELTRLASNAKNNLPGSGEALSAKISQVVRERGASLVAKEKDSDALPWPLITAGSGLFIGVISYLFGRTNGENNILNRLPEELVAKIRTNLEEEAKKRSEGLEDSYW